MDADIKGVLKTLDERSKGFREQVERIHRFRDKLKEAGVDLDAEPYTIPLMDKLETPPERVLSVFGGSARR